MVLNMDKEHINTLIKILILAGGNLEKNKEKELIHTIKPV
jgi:hypothetical protein